MTTSRVSDSDRHDWQARQFVSAGVQYYIAARAAALAGLMPISGNLFHHTVEMLLKAGIIQHSRTAPFAVTQKRLMRLRHNLGKTWETFRSCYPGAHLAAFGPLVTDLNRWEEIRYPDPDVFAGATGIAMSIVHHKGEHPIAKTPSGTTLEYYLKLEECDELIKALWEVLDFTPAYFRTFLVMQKLAKDLYEEDNRHQIAG